MIGITSVELSHAIKMRSQSRKFNRFQAYCELFSTCMYKYLYICKYLGTTGTTYLSLGHGN